jgi:hypothetical protein
LVFFSSLKKIFLSVLKIKDFHLIFVLCQKLISFLDLLLVLLNMFFCFLLLWADINNFHRSFYFMISFWVLFFIFLIEERIILNSDVHKGWLMLLGILLGKILFLHINFIKFWKSVICSIILFINIWLWIGSTNINWL